MLLPLRLLLLTGVRLLLVLLAPPSGALTPLLSLAPSGRARAPLRRTARSVRQMIFKLVHESSLKDYIIAMVRSGIHRLNDIRG